MALHTDAVPDPKAYRLLLKNIADNLTKRDFSMLKFLSLDIISRSKLEKVKSVIDILQEYENRCLLAQTNCSFLTELLYRMGRRDLVRKLMKLETSSVENRLKDPVYVSKLKSYRILLLEFGLEVPSSQLDNIKFIFKTDLSASSAEDAKDIWRFIELLEMREIIRPDCVEVLKEITGIIDQPNLSVMLDKYISTHQGKPDPDLSLYPGSVPSGSQPIHHSCPEGFTYLTSSQLTPHHQQQQHVASLPQDPDLHELPSVQSSVVGVAQMALGHESPIPGSSSVGSPSGYQYPEGQGQSGLADAQRTAAPPGYICPGQTPAGAQHGSHGSSSRQVPPDRHSYSVQASEESSESDRGSGSSDFHIFSSMSSIHSPIEATGEPERNVYPGSVPQFTTEARVINITQPSTEYNNIPPVGPPGAHEYNVPPVAPSGAVQVSLEEQRMRSPDLSTDPQQAGSGSPRLSNQNQTTHLETRRTGSPKLLRIRTPGQTAPAGRQQNPSAPNSTNAEVAQRTESPIQPVEQTGHSTGNTVMLNGLPHVVRAPPDPVNPSLSDNHLPHLMSDIANPNGTGPDPQLNHRLNQEFSSSSSATTIASSASSQYSQQTVIQQVRPKEQSPQVIRPLYTASVRPEPSGATMRQNDPVSMVPRQCEGGPDSLELPSYKMTANPRGFCVIINNEDFSKTDPRVKTLSNRPGSEQDARNLIKCFENLGFKIVSYRNKTSRSMYKIFKMLSDMPHEAGDALVVCILSHGCKGAVYGTDGHKVNIPDILCFFNGHSCPSLANKPKIFFIQACQGGDKHPPSKLQRDDAGDKVQFIDPPVEADFLVGYATVPGYVSYRHEDEGTWYINALVSSLDKYAHKYDLLSIMTTVNQQVAYKDANIENDQIYKQMPLPHSTLTKRIFLKPTGTH